MTALQPEHIRKLQHGTHRAAQQAALQITLVQNSGGDAYTVQRDGSLLFLKVIGFERATQNETLVFKMQTKIKQHGNTVLHFLKVGEKIDIVQYHDIFQQYSLSIQGYQHIYNLIMHLIDFWCNHLL